MTHTHDQGFYFFYLTAYADHVGGTHLSPPPQIIEQAAARALGVRDALQRAPIAEREVVHERIKALMKQPA